MSQNTGGQGEVPKADATDRAEEMNQAARQSLNQMIARFHAIWTHRTSHIDYPAYMHHVMLAELDDLYTDEDSVDVRAHIDRQRQLIRDGDYDLPGDTMNLAQIQRDQGVAAPELAADESLLSDLPDGDVAPSNEVDNETGQQTSPGKSRPSTVQTKLTRKAFQPPVAPASANVSPLVPAVRKRSGGVRSASGAVEFFSRPQGPANRFLAAALQEHEETTRYDILQQAGPRLAQEIRDATLERLRTAILRISADPSVTTKRTRVSAASEVSPNSKHVDKRVRTASQDDSTEELSTTDAQPSEPTKNNYELFHAKQLRSRRGYDNFCEIPFRGKRFQCCIRGCDQTYASLTELHRHIRYDGPGSEHQIAVGPAPGKKQRLGFLVVMVNRKKNKWIGKDHLEGSRFFVGDFVDGETTGYDKEKGAFKNRERKKHGRQAVNSDGDPSSGTADTPMKSKTNQSDKTPRRGAAGTDQSRGDAGNTLRANPEDIILTEATGYQCGLYALRESILAQLPDFTVPIPSIRQLEDILRRPQFSWFNWAVGREDTVNFSGDQLGAIIMAWGEDNGLNLQLAIQQEGAGVMYIGTPNQHAPNLQTIWIHNDNHVQLSAADGSGPPVLFNHWSGLRRGPRRTQ